MTDNVQAAGAAQWLPFADIHEPWRTRLHALFPEVPETFVTPAHFQMSMRDEGLLWISGQVPRFNETVRYKGIVGDSITVEDAQKAARLCTANFLSILAAACGGDLGKVERVVRITGYVRGVSDFTSQSQVINAASETLVNLFGDRGRHARSAIGVYSLPEGASVEIEGVVRLKA